VHTSAKARLTTFVHWCIANL